MAKKFLTGITIATAVGGEYTFPIADGSANQAIVTDGNGNLSFGSAIASTAEDAQRLVCEMINASGSSISAFRPVCCVGIHSDGTPEIALARADNPLFMPAIGITQSSVGNNNRTDVLLYGKLEGVNTTPYATGDTLYVAPTGGWATTRPTGNNLIQAVFKVGRIQQNNGSGGAFGAGQYQDLPNVPEGNVWIGNSNSYPIATPLSTAIPAALGFTPSDDSLVVKLAGAQVITGAKSFDAAITVNAGIGFLNGVMPNITSNLYSGIGGNSQGISIVTRPVSTNYTNNLYFATSNNSFTFPNATGTIALTSDLTAYVTSSRTLTINGTTYDLSADRSWTITTDASARSILRYVATASQTTFTISGGYTPGLTDVYRNGVKLDNSTDFTATNGTTIVLTNGASVNDVIEVYRYQTAFLANNALRTVTEFIATAGQTTFNVTYNSGLVDVFYNGSKLLSTEYAAGNGTTIVLNFPCNLNDTLEVHAYSYAVGAFTGQAQLNGTGLVRMSGTTVSYDNATYATQSYVTTAVANLVNSAPTTLDTLNELAAALGNDANFATTITTSIATKQPQLNGTGFVKISGTTISYDNSTYLTTSSASSTYLPLAGGTLTGALTGTSASFSSSITALESIYSTNKASGFSAYSIFQNGSKLTIAGGSGGIQFNNTANSSGLISIFDNGNVLIGTTGTDGGYKLDVSGTGRFSSTITAAALSQIGSVYIGGRTGTYAEYADGIFGDNLHLAATTGAVYINTLLNKNTYINPVGGNVGINATSLSSKFVVYEGDIRLWKNHIIDNTASWKANLIFTDEVDRLGARIVGERTAWDGAPMGIGFDTGGVGTVTRRMTIASNGFINITNTGQPISDDVGCFQLENTTASASSPANVSLTLKSYNGTSQFLNWENKGIRLGSRIKTNTGEGGIYFTYGNDTVGLTLTGTGNLITGEFVGVNTATRWNNERLGVQFSSTASWTSIPSLVRLTNFTSGGITKITFTDSSIIDGWIGMVPISGGSYFAMGFAGFTEQGFKLYQNGNYSFAGTNLSDRRLKNNIELISINAIDSICKMKPSSYYMNDGNGMRKHGFIAQEMQTAAPFLVSGSEEGYYGVDYDGVLALAIKAIQELTQKVNALENK
jgi:hypothetical protein